MRKNSVAMLVSSRLLVSLCVGQRLAGGGKCDLKGLCLRKELKLILRTTSRWCSLHYCRVKKGRNSWDGALLAVFIKPSPVFQQFQ